jgi:hypothetical protein
MKRSAFLPLALSLVVVALSAIPARSVDLESFEFADANGTALGGAVNTANPGNLWVEDAQMFPSDVRGGAYNIVKESGELDSNYLQVDNITSGIRYLVARISGWKFGDTIDAANLEDVRFGFLNDDDANFGSTITAQMQIERNSDGTIELVGNSLGIGSTNIAATAPFSATRSTPLTIALELNKNSNTYRVFYKDNTSPTQVLGLGVIAPTRDGNSLRFSANNSFAEGNLDYPFVPADEVFSVDRIALTDTNPFTDLITLEIDRASGNLTLRNTSGAALAGLESYSITSPTGPFDPTKWKTVTGNYDSVGDDSVDNAPWTVTSSTKTLLSESFQSGDGGGLSINQAVSLSVIPPGGTWLRSPFEDATMQLNLSGGVTRTVSVNYVGNGGAPWQIGDLNFDNNITAADYSVLVQFAETSLAGLTRVEAYRRGDLDGDGINSTVDFLQFKDIYEAANGGSGSFALMLANFNAVPEPGTATLLLVAAGLIATRRRRRKDQSTPIMKPLIQDRLMPSSTTLIRLCVALLVAAVVASASRAAILEDFPFSDPNTTLLEDAENVPNSGNNWQSSAAMNNSSVLNGSFRIQTNSTALQSNYLDIANVTSGKAWLVAEIAGWSLSSLVGPDEFDAGELEEVRFAFLDNDSNPPNPLGGSTITAQAVFIRNSMGGFNLSGIGPAGMANDLPNSLNLPLTQSNPFTMVVEIDEGTEQYSVYYKDNTDPFTLLGTTNHVGGRNGNTLRFAINNSFAGTGEFFDISRIYVTTDSPLGGPIEPIALTLEVKSNGMVSIVNKTDEAISFDTYRIASTDNSLNFAGWSPLGMLDAVGGGDEAGETWTPSAGSSDSVLAESFLLGESTADPDEIFPLGSAFKVGGSENLTFQYRDTVSGTLVTGLVDYVEVAGLAGDYNNDGIVDAVDYTVWRNHLNEPTEASINNNGNGSGGVDAADYTWWKQRYGNTNPGAGSGGLSLQAVPEPTALAMLCLAMLLSPVFRGTPKP